MFIEFIVFIVLSLINKQDDMFIEFIVFIVLSLINKQDDMFIEFIVFRSRLLIKKIYYLCLLSLIIINAVINFKIIRFYWMVQFLIEIFFNVID